ncbi:8-oxoguanine DNA glycosylase OGG fold protein [Gellertiella hungarica]|uniref:Uncharacterized protein n=1 Tax=Gellertiella hungarica TaxID=1572859 RepID=A0A7W6NKC0_9HYPH|nr:hypothetical protein [Gellertiella hungarica]MBB4064404.1 hypothetical protein [Gellertiella hungarica]
MTKLNSVHWAKFKELSSSAEYWPAANPRQFTGAGKFAQDCHLLLPDAELKRDDLKRLSADSSVPPESLFWSIMAWGGMRRSHCSLVSDYVKREIAPIIEDIRSGNLSRSDAYDRFKRNHAENRQPGLGPAFFTKLIFFCSPRHDGYIMDRWTGNSINLLFGDVPSMAVVRMTPAFYVDHSNTARQYEEFCTLVEDLAGMGKCSPEEIEIRLFAGNGKGHSPTSWRQYVRKQLKIPAGRAGRGQTA